MLTKDYINDEISNLCEDLDDLNEHSLRVLADLLFVKKNFHLMKCDEGFTKEMAETWVRGMMNSDGTKGAHWTKELTDTVLQKLGKDICPYTFWAVMNSIYSDYGKTLDKLPGITPDIYGELAMDWICDDDAVDGKAAAYFSYVVEHD